MVSGEPDFGELLVCVFGITESVAEVYRRLLTRPDQTANELSRRMDCDSSTVNRKLDTLREKGLVTRYRTLLDGGGYAYQYEPASLDRTREVMHRTLEAWAAFMHDRIDEVDEDLVADDEVPYG